jgi:hypothetical protein
MLWVLGLCSPVLSRVYRFKQYIYIYIYIYIIQKIIIQNNYYFNKIFQKNENVEEDVPLISMLHNKIKLEIDINNDELLEII